MGFHRCIWVSCALTLQLFMLQCRAQVPVDFFFQFPDFSSHTVTECQSIYVKATPINNTVTSRGTPPYYFIAMANGGMPTTALAGTDPDHLTWQVQHPGGSELLLTMVDSLGNSGGVAPALYTVVAGSDTSCLPEPPPSDIAKITPNVDTTLKTCEPWTLNITGGVKPYNVTIIAVNVPSFTNITFGPDDDILTWPNYVAPDHQLMAAVVDATGQWGISSPIVSTSGGSSSTCPGMQSISQTSAQFEAQEETANVSGSHASNNHAGVIAGVVVGLVVLLILLGVYLWWRRRRNRMKEGIVDGQDARPRGWTQLPSHSVESASNPFMTETGTVAPLPTKASLAEFESRHQRAPLVIYPQAPAFPSSPESSPMTRSNSTTPSVGERRIPTRSASMNSTSPAATRVEKTLTLLSGRSYTLPSRPYTHTTTSDASSVSERFSQRSFPIPRQNSMLSSRFAESSIQSPQSARLADGRAPDIIIQHLDGGVVEELPPPYLDRTDSLSSASMSTS